jgi:hypothetical protein
VPDVPLVPEVPDDADVPLDPEVPLEADVPLVPAVPLDPLLVSAEFAWESPSVGSSPPPPQATINSVDETTRVVETACLSKEDLFFFIAATPKNRLRSDASRTSASILTWE